MEGVNNGMMASVPGLPLWGMAVQILQERLHPHADNAWESGPIFQTGPLILGEVNPSLDFEDLHIFGPRNVWGARGLTARACLS